MKLKYVCSCLVFVCACFVAHAIRLPTATGAKSVACGGVKVVGIGFDNVYAQPAALAWHSQWLLGTTYSHGYFSDKNLSTKQVAIVMPVNKGAFGCQMQYFGFADYNERLLALSYGMRLGKQWAAGVQMHYLHIAQGGGYGVASAVSCNISMYAKLNADLEMGIQLYNPVLSGIGYADNKEHLPTGMQIGAMYRVDKNIYLFAEVNNRIDTQRTQLKIGVEYVLHPKAYVAIGYSTTPQRLHAGFGLRFANWQIDMATAYHHSLGFSPVLSLSYSFP